MLALLISRTICPHPRRPWRSAASVYRLLSVMKAAEPAHATETKILLLKTNDADGKSRNGDQARQELRREVAIEYHSKDNYKS